MATADETTQTTQNTPETATNLVVDDGAQLGVRRYFTIPERDPFDEVEWETRDAFIPGKDKPVFEQKGVDMRVGLDIAAFANRRSVDRIVLVTGDTDMIPAMKQAMAEADRDVGIEFRVFSTQVKESLVQERLMATLSSFFGALALVLAIVGLYELMSYTVGRWRARSGYAWPLAPSGGTFIG